MSTNKQLTAKVKLNVDDVERKINSIVKNVNKLNKAVNKSTGNGLEKHLQKSSSTADKLQSKLSRAYMALAKAGSHGTFLSKTILSVSRHSNKLAGAYDRISGFVNKIGNGIQKWASNTQTALSKLKPTRSIFSGIWSLVSKIASTLIGIGTIKLAITASDNLTGAENRLNNIAANTLGDSAFSKDASGNIAGYSQAAHDFTNETMSKIYSAAKNSRGSYSDMLSGVSKTMTLASDAFDNNIDNAVRFEEVMSKAFTISGASAAEMSNSMYQLRQALAAGQLAGDEMKSVMENAPLAYQKIEKYIQGCFEGTEYATMALKDLGAEGVVTSEMIVAAILDAGDEIDQRFALTKWRFSEVWNSIKSSAERAFQPLVGMLGDLLNKAVDNGLIEKFEKGFFTLSKGAMIALKSITLGVQKVIDFIHKAKDAVVNNIDLVKNAIAGVISVLLAYYAILGVIALVNAVIWIAQHWALLLTIALIASVIYMLYQWANGTISTGQLILGVLAVIAGFIILIGILIGSTTMIMVGIVLLALLIIASQSSNLCEFLIHVGTVVALAIFGVLSLVMLWSALTGATIMSTTMMTVLVVIGLVLLFVAMFLKYTQQIMAFIYAAGAFVWNLVASVVNGLIQFVWTHFVEPFLGIIEWILNACNGGFNSFGGAVANLIGNIISWFLSLGKVVTKIIDAIFGTNWTDGLNALQDKVLKWGKKEDSITINREAPDIMERKNVGDAWDKGWQKGTDIQNTINSKLDGFNSKEDKLSSLTNKLNLAGSNKDPSKWTTEDRLYYENTGEMPKNTFLDGLGDKLGLNFGDPFGLPKGADTDYDKLINDVGNIDASTGSIADSMELTQDDLEYLREIADMEWKKEFTTANIIVDMQNTNTINNQGDLDNWVVSLRDALAEELNVVANGVYA